LGAKGAKVSYNTSHVAESKRLQEEEEDVEEGQVESNLEQEEGAESQASEELFFEQVERYRPEEVEEEVEEGEERQEPPVEISLADWRLGIPVFKEVPVVSIHYLLGRVAFLTGGKSSINVRVVCVLIFDR
jgi:hypothetical protein